MAVLASIVRNIAREPRIGAYSIVAFNLKRNEILYRGRSAPQLDLQALGEAMKRLRPGTIDLRSLRDGDSGMRFLGDLVVEELTKNHPDAVIFVGPRSTEDRATSRSQLMELEAPRCPVFYLTYDTIPVPVSRPNVDVIPIPIPRRDPIGSTIKLWKGFGYTIGKPRDLFKAWTEVMSQISNSRTTTALAPKN
jgi:hypothetical protein